MTATFAAQKVKNFNINHRKDNGFKAQWSAVVYDCEKNTMHEPVVLRSYQTESRDYCCLWVFGPELYRSGSGWAGGGNYHRASAAACEAIYNAGIELSEPINGRGDSAIREAVEAIADAIFEGRKHLTFVSEAHP